MTRHRSPSNPLMRAWTAGVMVAIVMGCGGPPSANSTIEAQDPPGPAPANVDEASALGALRGPWRAEPIPLWPALLEAIARECAGSMQPFPAAQLVAADARGKGTIQALFAGPGAVAACYDMTIDASGTVSAMGGGMTGTGPRQGPLDAHGLLSGDVSGSEGPGNVIASSVISGQAGAGIARVRIAMPGQVPMTATLANGWYVFWWPGAIPAGTTVIGLDGFGGEVAKSDP